MFLLLIPFVSANEYASYNYLDLNFSVSSKIIIEKTVDNPRLDYVDANLNFFPKDDDRQKVIYFKTKPTASIEKEESLNYHWTSIEDKLTFGLDSRVKVENKFSEIKRKINFPVANNYFLEYTRATKNIDITPSLKDKANDIVEGETDLYMAVFKLAEWTRNNVKYDLNTLTENVVQRSSWVLANKEGVCDEITSLFISFNRALGIPARFVSGVVYSNLYNDWGSHGWAEVYFPNYGWVPFDVTFGQYGWIDASHIKLKDSLDSEESSVEYKWKSYGININTKKLELNTKLNNKGNLIETPVSLKIKALKDEVGFGSYVPIEVYVKNLKDYYISIPVYLTKAPKLLEENVKIVLLKPGEVKKLYWIIEIPKDLDKNLLYTSVLEVGSLGSKDESTISYSDKYEFYSLEKAEEAVKKFSEREDKTFFTYLDFKCLTDKEVYYSDEDVKVECFLKNKGNVNLRNLNVCLEENCKLINLGISEADNVQFDVKALEGLTVVVENKDMIQNLDLNLKVIEIPKVDINDLEPILVDYKDEVSLSFFVKSNTLIKDVVIDVGFGIFKINELNGGTEIILPAKGKDLINGIKFDISYKDEIGKEYNIKKKFDINVENVPWYIKIVSWFSKLS